MIKWARGDKQRQIRQQEVEKQVDLLKRKLQKRREELLQAVLDMNKKEPDNG